MTADNGFCSAFPSAHPMVYFPRFVPVVHMEYGTATQQEMLEAEGGGDTAEIEDESTK